jgi:hypothetical protein
MNKKALIEAVKEFFRVVVLAVIPILITSLETNTLDLKVVAVVGVVAGLRFVDKYLHETGMEQSTKTEESKLVKGLVRF